MANPMILNTFLFALTGRRPCAVAPNDWRRTLVLAKPEASILFPRVFKDKGSRAKLCKADWPSRPFHRKDLARPVRSEAASAATASGQNSYIELCSMSTSNENDQADRAISTGKLHTLLRFHTQPINVVVFHDSQGILVFRLVSRLDAFSGYPFRI